MNKISDDLALKDQDTAPSACTRIWIKPQLICLNEEKQNGKDFYSNYEGTFTAPTYSFGLS